MHFLSRLFACLYWSKKQRFLGMTIRAWLLWLLIALGVAALISDGPPAVTVVAGAALVLLLLAYVVAGRLGYTRFFGGSIRQPDLAFAPPRAEHRIPLRATGRFSARNREAYLVEQPAEYWRVPLGQHVFMVQQQPGRFLYQSVEPSQLLGVKAGQLAFGSAPQTALAVHFRATWGPDSAAEPRYYYAGAELEPEPVGRAQKIYLTFSSEAHRHAVWRSLLETSHIGATSRG